MRGNPPDAIGIFCDLEIAECTLVRIKRHDLHARSGQRIGKVLEQQFADLGVLFALNSRWPSNERCQCCHDSGHGPVDSCLCLFVHVPNPQRDQ